MPHWRRSSRQGLQEPFPSLPAKTSTELRPDLLIFVFLSWLRNLSQNMRQPLFTYLPACLFGGKEEKQALKVLNILSLPKIKSVPPPAGGSWAGLRPTPVPEAGQGHSAATGSGASWRAWHHTEGSWKLRPQPGRGVTRPQETPLLGARIWRTTAVVFVSQLRGSGPRPPAAPHAAGLLSRRPAGSALTHGAPAARSAPGHSPRGSNRKRSTLRGPHPSDSSHHCSSSPTGTSLRELGRPAQGGRARSAASRAGRV